MSVIKARKSQLYYPVCSKEGSTKYDPKKTEKKREKEGIETCERIFMEELPGP